MRKPFNRLQALMIKAMAEALFYNRKMAVSADQVVENLQEHFTNIDGQKPDEIRLALYGLFLVLGGPFFLAASPRIRKKLIGRRLQKSRIDFLQDIARTKGVILAGYYGHWQHGDEEENFDNPVLVDLDFQLPAQRDRSAPGERPVRRETHRDLTADVFVGHGAIPEEADVIVIGSGAGGAVAAAAVADEGHGALIIEAGSHYPSSRLTHEEARMTARLFKDGGLQTTADRDIIVFQGRVVGGSTVINNGICLRMKQDGLVHPDAEDVYETWARLGAPISEVSLAASYDAVEQMLNVSEIDIITGRNNGPHLINGWTKYAAQSGDPMDKTAITAWFRKNYGPPTPDSQCVYCGYCNTGCPYGRKKAMPESYLAHATSNAREKPARILDRAEATEILWTEGANGKRIADAVKITLKGGGKRVIRARKGVVVAAGALASSNLLYNSGILQSGSNISLNIACPVVALMPEGTRVNAWDEDQMATYIDRGDFLIESHFQPPMSMAMLVPGWFEDHYERMKNYSRLVSAGVLFPADRLGHMKNGKLKLKIGEPELALLRRALATMTKVHFLNGAIEVYPALLRGQTLTADMSHEAIDAFYKKAIVEPDDVVLSSSHPHGGNAINEDPHRGVVDLNQRVHNTTNCYVTDASVMPSCIRVNAQLTTMAMAHRAMAGKRRFG
ncbi:GMC family oxidoreductase N-terminal domain-containing protein [uncultured Parasphingorhabdus sp.]|uniref:GMC family oxidoreductase N-terminal domain-containing protein n=1 Tax=uncultured Parasphingorhabdus sp. TaxID=2709694 RepID=UPI002AA66F37|nr:GMC family oxidoreductase N-terminal domain-containing protein [uncultured Parasphingorhabdus sp.]